MGRKGGGLHYPFSPILYCESQPPDFQHSMLVLVQHVARTVSGPKIQMQTPTLVSFPIMFPISIWAREDQAQFCLYLLMYTYT